MWQEIAIIIIALGVVVYVGFKIHHAITAPKGSNPCIGCPGCGLMTDGEKEKKC